GVHVDVGQSAEYAVTLCRLPTKTRPSETAGPAGMEPMHFTGPHAAAGVGICAVQEGTQRPPPEAQSRGNAESLPSSLVTTYRVPFAAVMPVRPAAEEGSRGVFALHATSSIERFDGVTTPVSAGRRRDPMDDARRDPIKPTVMTTANVIALSLLF